MDLQPLKALSPILVKVSGNVTEVVFTTDYYSIFYR